MLIRPYQPTDESTVIRLWERTGLIRSWNNPRKDIERKQGVQSEWFLVGLLNDNIIATAMVGYDGHRGWINYLAVDSDFQGNGYGREMMNHAEKLLHEFGCPKINLQIRKDNLTAIAFYKSIGFIEDAAVSFGKRLIPDD